MIDTSTPTSTREREAQELNEKARTVYLASLALGHQMTGKELGEACGGLSDSWGRGRIREIKASLLPPSTSPVPSSEPEAAEPERQATSPAALPETRSLPPMVTPPAADEPSAIAEEGVGEDAETAESAEPERNDSGTSAARQPPVVWPVWLLLLPASVAIWSGWVGLGSKAGFGPVQLLPGIADVEINTAITLPIGMEVYSAYALYVWLSGKTRGRALRFARFSAIIALLVGALGQVAYHILEAAGVGVAPWWITAAVACLPVGVVGLGAALAHMVRAEDYPNRVDPVVVPAVPVR
jgi:hypothetical protein